MVRADRLRHGAIPGPSGTTFTLWAPSVNAVELELIDSGDRIPMQQGADGVYSLVTDRAPAGTRYKFRVDGEHSFPDPASRFQPEGVHGPSVVVDSVGFKWTDGDWRGITLSEMVIYELHIGTFSPEGSFDGVIDRLEYLQELGINTIELMPVADFPGDRNWGYDHAALFAPSRAYGRPDDLRRLVDKAHSLGMAVLLDVIYNHFGPDGAYAAAFAPFFTKKHDTPWGLAVNLDDKGSEGVRRYFIDNALYWMQEFHFDGLRLDATDALIDDSETHFLEELRSEVDSIGFGPRRILIAEDHRNLNMVLKPLRDGGYGMDGVWADDLHHLLRHQTAGDTEAYYSDYIGTTTHDIARTIERGWFFDGVNTPSSDREPGTDPTGLRPEQFVVCIQNHDQIGNRPFGDRLTEDIDLPMYRALSALLLFLPQTPLLFMGQEWAASSPFLFFTDHNEELGRAVTKGRRNEFKGFKGFSTEEVPDPQSTETFERSRLNWSELGKEPHSGTLSLYRDLIELRRNLGGTISAEAIDDSIIRLKRGSHELVVCLGEKRSCVATVGKTLRMHTEAARYGGSEKHEPVLEEDTIRFAGPAAALFVHDYS
jgi:maltooligosyltrehalose trehalohydrolase